MTQADIDIALADYAAAARRCREAGFDALDVHGAHGYLIHAFLSPISNQRTDGYGGDLEGRMRFALEVAEAVRSEWPEDKPLFYRISCIDDEPGGWTLDESIVLAAELGLRGVDVIDCSSRGLGLRGTPVVTPREQGFQVPFAERIKQDTDLVTMAVGLIMNPAYAETVVADGRADLVAIGREALNNPNWPLHAANTLMGDDAYDSVWHPRTGWWLSKRAKSLAAAKQMSRT
jgi:2,4-dienoyl-CoA reductase-like NADH-dependent reductase (Old Yellow Enzyme family)